MKGTVHEELQGMHRSGQHGLMARHSGPEKGWS